MDDETPREMTRADADAGESLLRELAGVEPAPRDVVVRLERRLDEELGGRPAPAARRRRRRWLVPALGFGVPVAVAAVVAVAVLGGRGGETPQVSAFRSATTAESVPAPTEDSAAKSAPTATIASGGAVLSALPPTASAVRGFGTDAVTALDELPWAQTWSPQVERALAAYAAAQRPVCTRRGQTCERREP